MYHDLVQSFLIMRTITFDAFIEVHMCDSCDNDGICSVPSTFFDLFAGYTFGITWGWILGISGKMLGSTGAFAIGRYLIQDYIRHKLEQGEPMFRAWVVEIK